MQSLLQKSLLISVLKIFTVEYFFFVSLSTSSNIIVTFFVDNFVLFAFDISFPFSLDYKYLPCCPLHPLHVLLNILAAEERMPPSLQIYSISFDCMYRNHYCKQTNRKNIVQYTMVVDLRGCSLHHLQKCAIFILVSIYSVKVKFL